MIRIPEFWRIAGLKAHAKKVGPGCTISEDVGFLLQEISDYVVHACFLVLLVLVLLVRVALGAIAHGALC